MGFDAWPEKEAQTIKGFAQEVDMLEGVNMVERLRNIVLGNAELVESYSRVWVPESVDALTNAQNEFMSAASRVNDAWTGGAAGEFQTWVSKYNVAMNQCKEAMQGPQDALWKCSAEITRTYSSAIKMVGRIAAELVEITSDIINNPLNIMGEIGEIIMMFIREATTLLGDSLERMQGYREAMARMRGAIVALADLVPMGHVVGDPTGWQPRPTPAG